MASIARFQDVMTLAVSVIHVPERGTLDLQSAEWQKVSRSAIFWNLVDRGILSVEQLRGGRARLKGNCYVGRSRVADDLVIEMHEKVPGSLAALLNFSAGTDFRIEHVPGPKSDLGPLIAILIEHFVGAVRLYASRGRQFQYDRIKMTGSLIGGRLDVTRTTKLWAQGLRHLAAFEKNEVAFNTPVNRTILSALREIERIARLVALPPQTLAQARSMAMLFSDCRTAEVLFGARSEAARQAERLAASTSDKALSDILGLASIVLAHESFDYGQNVGGTTPRSWFLNLETLFERAVRRSIESALANSGQVATGRRASPRIFPTVSAAFRANPDLVVRQKSAGRPCIGDVKYKQWSGSPAASDIYQLLVHSSAYEADRSFLAFPADDFFSHDLGEAVTGASVSVYGLDVRRLEQDVSLMLRDLGFLSRQQAASYEQGRLAFVSHSNEVEV
ncbi:5-methylcytosine restriction system specificity protein McrC [Paracoccus sp. ME4]|uniref:5-methylcytosine restriction system specificity protein McrC n=1 Tax=Paracoccus sp. ME4 TaxID=3138066 RepID=UPI00398AD5FC